MVAQAFAYNGIFFTYPAGARAFLHVAADRVGTLSFAVRCRQPGGPLVLGSLFDRLGLGGS